MSTRRARKADAVPLSPLAAAVAEPAKPGTETGAAYADRQMAAYGVEPSRWATDVLRDALAHLVTCSAYRDHADRTCAELVERGSPDAALFALCARLEAMQAQWRRLYDATSDEEQLTTPADHAWQRYSDSVWPCTSAPRGGDALDVPALLLTLPATTPEGVAVKAAAILALDAAGSYCDPRDDSLDLCMSLVHDAAGLAVDLVGAEAVQPPLRPVSQRA